MKLKKFWSEGGAHRVCPPPNPPLPTIKGKLKYFLPLVNNQIGSQFSGRSRISQTVGEGASTFKVGCQPIIWSVFPKNCMKMKKCVPPLDPPMQLIFVVASLTWIDGETKRQKYHIVIILMLHAHDSFVSKVDPRSGKGSMQGYGYGHGDL